MMMNLTVRNPGRGIAACMFNLPEADVARSNTDVENVLKLLCDRGIDEDDVVTVERMGRFRGPSAGRPRPIKIEFATHEICSRVVGLKQLYYQTMGHEIQVNVQWYRPKEPDRHRQRRRDDEGLASLRQQFSSLNTNSNATHYGAKLPSGWLDYTKMGQRVHRTRIVAIKTPLKSQFNAGLEEFEHFTCDQAVELARRRRLQVGMVVNLTYTDKYYDPQTFADLGVELRKIKVPGKMVPLEHLVQSFIRTVKEFEEANRRNDDVILVHCTHGLNRTGYMVCRYLMQELGLRPDEAIHSFNLARGHDMERENYLESLRSRR